MASSDPADGWQIDRIGDVALAWSWRPRAGGAPRHPAERLALAARGALAPARRREWLAGRRGLRSLLPAGAGVGAWPDGSPRVVGAAWLASIAHEGGWVVVAARPAGEGGAIAIDVVPGTASAAARRAVARLEVGGALVGRDPAAAWTALECAAKLRRAGIAALLDRRMEIRRGAWVAGASRRSVEVVGLGRPVRVTLARLPGAIVAVADDPSPGGVDHRDLAPGLERQA